jgi:ATP-dependent helicase/nuclease subunit B
MSRPTPRVFNIPASAPFLPTLVSALLDGRLIAGFPVAGDPLALAEATLYLPTRRACRLAREVFLDVIKADAAILPRIVALGDIDEDELAFADAATGEIGAQALDLPDALGGLKRRMLLTKLVLQWAAMPGMRGEQGTRLVASSPAAAFALADDLARLMDDMTTRQVPWDRLDGLVPDHVDQYWQLTLDFLKIAREQWPNLLRVHGAIEPAERRDRLIAAEAARLAKSNSPVIAAGSTGSMPATAALLATIARLPQGAVVLPGLDTDLDEAAWNSIGGEQNPEEKATSAPVYGHPQYALHGLLRRLGISRVDVQPIVIRAKFGRETVVSEALRPAATTEFWQSRLGRPEFSDHAEAALAGIAVIEAASAEEEALAIAIALREALETPGKTAALVTPDRALARRVLAALRRWNVTVDDTAGDKLADTPAGVFARLAAEAALGGLAPVTLLALLKHPLCRLSAAMAAHTQAAAVLEKAVLRGARPRSGSAGLAQALTTLRHGRKDLHGSDPRKHISDQELDAADAFVARLASALQPLENKRSKPESFVALTARHQQVVETLSRDPAGDVATYGGSDGKALARAFEQIAELTDSDLAIAPSDYSELFHAGINNAVYRPPLPGARVRIFGPLEARLQTVDRLVIGGLVEGVWPPESRSDPWLSRPMRHDLGLDLPERRIGLSAHDFAQFLGAPEIILTRAAKLAGAPTVPSRFLQRLAAVAGARWAKVLERGAHYVELARVLDRPTAFKQIERPRPRPPREARPTALSVTQIEHWLRDPYTIYARHILKLNTLDAVDTPPGAADRGTIIHDAIGDFTAKFAHEWPADPLRELLDLGKQKFEPYQDFPEARAFWWPRFERIAHWFVTEFEPARRRNSAGLVVEQDGYIDIPLGERSFRLRTRADRIETRPDGRYAILDYKTGAPPSESQVKVGLSPQLTLEAAILRHGKFQNLPGGGSVAELAYVRLRGTEIAGEVCLRVKDKSPDVAADYALERLTEIARLFENEKEPYRSLVHPMWTNRYGEYDHLARVQEWSLAGGTDEPDDWR